MKKYSGYMMIMLLLLVSIMSLGLMLAVPVWKTQIQRENEEELIFRGNQFVEAIRLYQLKNPGTFPKTLEELVEKKCLRRLYRDPMTPEGEWSLILQEEGIGGGQPRAPVQRQGMRGRGNQRQREVQGQSFRPQKVLVVPAKALSSIRNARIIGVVSSSTAKSIKLYNDQESYDKWLFYYGQDSKNLPEIEYYGQSAKDK
jgi:type II secretory pathway pseudopilin PulG